MAPPEAPLWCVFCSGGIGDGEWTRRFKIVYLRNDEVHISTFFYDRSLSLQEVLSPTPSEQTRIRTNSYATFTSAGAFLIHQSCLFLMERFLHPSLETALVTRPEPIFRVCQSLQPDKERNFGHPKGFELSGCPDPNQSIMSYISPVRSKDPLKQKPNIMSQSSVLLRLPVEVMIMILEYLPPSSLVGFFHSSMQCLDYAPQFCHQKRPHFYGCIDTDGTIDPPAFHAFLRKITPVQFAGLDKRWEVVTKLRDVARHIPKAPVRRLTAPTLDVRAPCQYVPHSFGFEELTLDIPDDVKTIAIRMTAIHGNYYVSGIEFESGEAHIVDSESSFLKRVVFPPTGIDLLRFVVDGLGIRTLKFGDSQWIIGSPESIQCWEGFSMRRTGRRIRIVRDMLKFRQISWSHVDSPPFEECILMREKHALFHGSISEQDFAQQELRLEENLIAKFGNFTTEAIWLDNSLCGITMYYSFNGISGVSLHTTTGTQTVGGKYAMAIFFPIHGPGEVITEIETRTRSPMSPLAIVLRTNWGRHCVFGSVQFSQTPCTKKSLRPPHGCHIRGFYFRLGPMSIESLGLIFSSGLRGSAYQCIVSPPEMPKMDPEYEFWHTGMFESCAWLSGVKKIWLYFDTNRCTGLRLFYLFNNSEVIGRTQGDFSREVVVSDEKQIRRIRIVQEGRTVENIEFETDDTGDKDKDRKGKSYEIANSTAIAWWYSEIIDIVRVFAPKSSEMTKSD